MEKEQSEISQIIKNQIKVVDFEIDELIKDIPFSEFIQKASFYIGYKNALLKANGEESRNRQSYITTLCGIAFDYLLRKYTKDSLLSTTINNANLNLNTSFDIVSQLFDKALYLDGLKTTYNCYCYDNWDYEKIKDNHFRQIVPEKSKSFINQTQIANSKGNSLLTYNKNFIDDMFGIYTESVPDNKQYFSGYNSNEYSIIIDKSNIKELLTSGFFCRYSSELGSFLFYLPNDKVQQEIKLEINNKTLNISNILKIYTLISEISRLHIKRIYDEFNQATEINTSNYLIVFEKESLIDLIAFALDISEEKSDIEYALNLLCFDSENPKSNFFLQPFLCNNTQIYWLPNSFAYQSLNEMFFEALLLKENETLNNIQTQLIEKYYNRLFGEKGFKICEDDNNRTIRSFGDFDILAYKNGCILNFEIKLSGVKNEIKEIFNWKKSKLGFKAATDQLPKLRKYIEENKPDILRRLGLPSDTKIDNIHSFIASNSFLFDNEYFNGFMKVSLFELTVLLTDTEINAQEFIDYLKHSILYIKDHTNNPKPLEYIKWAQNEIEVDIKTIELIGRYVEHFKPSLWLEKDNPSIDELVNHLKNKRLFGHFTENNNIGIQYNSININDIIIEVPILK